MAIDDAMVAAPAEIRQVVQALQALRGAGKIVAVSLVAEVGSLSRFSNPRQLMSYAGLVSCEYSSGHHIQRGGITKTGNSHLRRVIVEAAWRSDTNRGLEAGWPSGNKGWTKKPKPCPGKRSGGCASAITAVRDTSFEFQPRP